MSKDGETSGIRSYSSAVLIYVLDANMIEDQPKAVKPPPKRIAKGKTKKSPNSTVDEGRACGRRFLEVSRAPTGRKINIQSAKRDIEARVAELVELSQHENGRAQ
jgi:hypothetical protein